MIAAWLLLSAVPSYDASQRVAYLEVALEAVAKTPAREQGDAHEFVAAMERGACSASAIRLKTECLMTAARRFCKGKEALCPALMDVVISNVLAEAGFVSADRRYEIMKTHRDWHAEVAREIRRIQGSVAVDFRLRPRAPGASLASRINDYCVAAADKSNLSWQTCASTLVWFIGSTPKGGAIQ